jgi:ABC-type Fe3+-siderophore transport system permease subunit
MKNGFLKSISGRDSSTRLIGFAVIPYAMLMAYLVLYWGKEAGSDIMQLSIAAGTLFSMIAGPTFVWMYGQKKTEVKQEINETD